MRLLFVTHRFLPRFTAGTEIYTALMAQALARLGHAVQIFTGDPEARAPYAAEWQGLPVQAVPWGVGFRPGAVATYLASFLNPAVERRFDAVCRAFQPDVVHIQHLMGLSPRLPAIAQRHGARVVVTLHDYWFACSNTWLFRWSRVQCPGPGSGYHCGGCALHRLHHGPQPALMALAAPIFAARTRVLRRALLRADYLIAPSQAVARRLAGQGLPLARFNVVAHGVVSGPGPMPAPRGPGVRFVYIGSLTPPKGIHIAVQAFNRLSGTDSHFDVYANLAEDPDYARELQALNRGGAVIFKGPLPHERLDEVLASADMLVLPSLWDEPFSMVVDEALHAGVPVLFTDRGAPQERLTPGVNGLMAAAGDVDAWAAQMRQAVADPQLLGELRRGARTLKLAQAHAQELEAIYSRLQPQGGAA